MYTFLFSFTTCLLVFACILVFKCFFPKLVDQGCILFCLPPGAAGGGQKYGQITWLGNDNKGTKKGVKRHILSTIDE